LCLDGLSLWWLNLLDLLRLRGALLARFALAAAPAAAMPL
jgi:hypothetical protein